MSPAAASTAGAAAADRRGGGLRARRRPPTEERPAIKWPNDVVVAGPDGPQSSPGSSSRAAPRRAGRCSGSELNVAVDLGCCCPSERAAARPRHWAGAPTRIEPLLARLLVALEHRLASRRPRRSSAWRARDALRGQTIGWGTQGQGSGARSGIAAGDRRRRASGGGAGRGRADDARGRRGSPGAR